MITWGLKVFSYNKSPFYKLPTASEVNTISLDWFHVGEDPYTVGKTIGAIQIYHAGADFEDITILGDLFSMYYGSVGTLFCPVELNEIDYLTFKCTPSSTNFFARFEGIFNNAIVHPMNILGEREYKYSFDITSTYNQVEYVNKNINGNIVTYHLYYYTLPTSLLDSLLFPVSEYYGFFGNVYFKGLTSQDSPDLSAITVSKHNDLDKVIPLEKFSSISTDVGRRFNGFFPVLKGRLDKPSIGLVTAPYLNEPNPPLLPISVTVYGWLHKNQTIVKCHSPEMSQGSSFQVFPQKSGIAGKYIDLPEDKFYPEILYSAGSFGNNNLAKLKDLSNLNVGGEAIDLLSSIPSQALPYFTNIGTLRR